MYQPSVKARDNLRLRRGPDIDELNRLQILNADEYLILSKPDYSEYIASLHKPLQRRRRVTPVTMTKQSVFNVGEEHREIHVTRPVAINYTPHLSFFKKDKPNVESFVEGCEKTYKERIAKFGYNKPFVFVRNEMVCASFESEMEKVRKKMPEN
jgi:hypothetical protein